MTTRENLEAALDGGTPEMTPYSFYSWMDRGMLKTGLGADDPSVPNPEDIDPKTTDLLHLKPLPELYEQGLGICHHVGLIERVEHGVENETTTKVEDGVEYTIFTKKTPIGTVRKINRGSWHFRDWIEEPNDYLIWKWIVDHTELIPRYERLAVEEERIGDHGVCVVMGSRTPALIMNVDLAGVMRFCTDMASGVEEFHALYESLRKRFMEETELIARAPGHFVKWLENLTAPVFGPQYYRDLVVSVYNEAVPQLEAVGKRVMVHYDGQLSFLADEIAQAPVHIIESLSEAPEGDLDYEECRRLWPDKAFWGNLNVGLYTEDRETLVQAVRDKRERAGKRGFAFEISEKMPDNWQEVIPIVLEALEAIG